MSQYSVIKDVSETLQQLLIDKATDTIEVTVNSPQKVTLSSSHLLNLYLYQVVEDQFAKNQEPMRRGARQLVRSPLALNLFYMLTPYVPDTENSIDEHLILGDAMRIFYDNPIITDPHLRGALKGTGEEIRISLCTMNLEEQTRIWNALQMSYRLSVSYEVKIALIDSQNVWDISRVEIQETLYGQQR